jgi:multimeric flavodoxin WrbA
VKTLLIVFHSATGGTRQMAEAAFAAATEAGASPQGRPTGSPRGSHGGSPEGTKVRLIEASDAEASDILGADGYLFACPENLAAMAGRMKDFFDRAYYDVLDQVNGRPYAAMICAGSDGTNAARQIARIATGWRLREVAEPLIVCTHAQTKEAIQARKSISEADLDRCRELGAALAVGIELGVF